MRRGAVRGAIALLVAWLGAVAASAAPDLRVRGSALVDGPGGGHVVQLRGINRSGLEYACIEGWGFFDGPHPAQIDDPGMIAAMKSWDINAVRVPVNADCWLGIGTHAGYGGAPYRAIVKRYVRALNAAHLYVILDLHWTSPQATGQIPMADSWAAPRFWRSVASTFKTDHALIFDLYNEPFGISWRCWLRGCAVPAGSGYPAYRAAGMQLLVDVVRGAGANQPLMLGGLSWSLDLSGWLAHMPKDPAHQLLASEHNYGRLSPCDSSCRAAILLTRRKVPVVMGELGETDCAHGYIDQMMPWDDRHGIGYLGWAWDAVAPSGWDCSRGPALITSYNGTPTAFGIGFRTHFRAMVGTLRRP